MSAVHDYDNPITARAGHALVADWRRIFGSRRGALELPSDGGATAACVNSGDFCPAQPLSTDPLGHLGLLIGSGIYGTHVPYQKVVNASAYGSILNATNFFESSHSYPSLSANTAAATGRVTITSTGEITANTANLNAFEIALAHIDAADLVTQQAINVSSPLSDVILMQRSVAKVDKESVDIADAATSDALAVIQRANLGGDPRVMFSSDGILTLQWQRGEHGAALIFAGDGVASLAFRQPGQFYAENGIDIDISEELPARFNTALAAILA